MGYTEVPKELFLEYIEQLKNVYTADKYHLLDNNCNTFSNEVCQFLTGKTLPDYITGLPRDFLNTPLGQQLRPLIDGFFRSDTRNSFIPSVSSADNQNASTLDANVESDHAGLLTYPDTVEMTDTFVKEHVASVLYFSQSDSPECQKLEPEFIQLIGQYSKTPGKIINVAKIDIKQHSDIAYVYSARYPPIFKFYLNGEKINELSNSDTEKLEDSLKDLYRLAYPPHSHTALALENIEHLSVAPIQFPEGNPILQELKKPTCNLIPTWTSDDDSTLAALLGDESHVDSQVLTKTIEKLIDSSLSGNSSSVEVLSEIVLQADGVKGVLVNPERFNAVFEKTLWQQEPMTDAILRLTCNMLSTFQGASSILLESPESPRQSIVELVVDSLLSESAFIRKSASYVLYNISIWIGRDRRQQLELIKEAEVFHFSDDDSESCHVELISAAVSAVQMDTSVQDEQVTQNLVFSLAHLMFCGSDTLISLANILGLQSALEEISSHDINSSSKLLIVELLNLLTHDDAL
ncbi:hypothetical protein K7432_009955 [Basidiobolus ranarum]|uniref:PPPDE domain-containing protein n=1 Tax=Basidiobolus ranarum TaxID=34480 RepID=A0ABR2VWE3_9FUNG